MPIKGITDQIAEFPEIGQLRKGSVKRKKGNKEIWGEDLDHFRFTSEIPKVRAEFAEVYDGEPRMVNVLLPHPTVDENFDAWQEEYVAGGLVHRCDSETMVLWLDEDGSYSTEQKPCPYATGEKKRTKANPGCKPTGRLKVIIIELQRMAYVTVLTSSIHDIRNLSAQLRALFRIRRDLTGIPMQLRRAQKTISTPGQGGKRVRRQKWLLSIEATPTYSKLQLAAQERAARPQLTAGKTDSEVVVDGETGEVLDGEEALMEDLFEEEPEEEAIRETRLVETPGDPEPLAEEPEEEPVPEEEEGEYDFKAPHPWVPEKVRGLVEKNGARMAAEALTEGQLKAVNSLLSKAVTSQGMKQADIDRRRHRVMAYLAGVRSSKDLTKGQASGIIEWLKDGPTWDLRPHAKAEVDGILSWVSRNGDEEKEPNFTPPPDFLDVEIPAGEHAGKKLSWLAINDREYLERIAGEAKDRELREAARATIELMAEEVAQPSLF